MTNAVFSLTARVPACRHWFAALMLAVLHTLAWSALPTPPVVAPSAPGPVKTRTYSLSFKQLGMQAPLGLRGVEALGGVPLNIRADEVVVAAHLRLLYAYSPALLPESSHLAVLINGEPAATLTLPSQANSANTMRDIVLDPRMLGEFNQITMSLVAHYTQQCEDPLHSSLWATISNRSTLELTVAAVTAGNDLRTLPEPFFDRRDPRPLVLPFVFGTRPALPTVEAGGTLASWFGKLAGYRGALFPAQLNTLPEQGNAVIFATPQDAPAGLVLPDILGPTVSMVSNPGDPTGKFLLILGRNSAELKKAVAALAFDARALNGASSVVLDLPVMPARLPGDAPNWIATSHAVRLGELASAPELTVHGYNPDLVRINLRFPPDLFTWHSGGIPLDLNYRFTPRPVEDKSSLNISLNASFIESLKLPAVRTASPYPWLDAVWPQTPSQSARRIILPAYALAPNSQLQFHYQYDLLRQADCRATLLDNVNGTIDPDSRIDLSQLPHFIALPDLAVFANSGFPFTRLADLSATAVVLPNTPSAIHYSTFFALMGRMGAATGYPATGVTLALPADVASVSGKDLIVFGTKADQPLFAQWQPAMPFFANDRDGHFMLVDWAGLVPEGWREDRDTTTSILPSLVSLRQDAPGGLLFGFESPLQKGRSVVGLQMSQNDDYDSVLQALILPEQLSKIHGSVVLLRAGQLQTLEDVRHYHLGQLPTLMYLQWILSTHPWWMALLAIGGSVLLGLLVFLALRRRAGKRLGSGAL